jgi:hypothetical protein
VPAESISNFSEHLCSSSSERKAPSAVGDLQILPIQTNNIFVFTNVFVSIT